MRPSSLGERQKALPGVGGEVRLPMRPRLWKRRSRRLTVAGIESEVARDVVAVAPSRSLIS